MSPTALLVKSVVSKYPAKDNEKDPLAKTNSSGESGELLIRSNSLKVSCTAGAVASVLMEPPAPNNPGPRRYAKTENAPYVYPCSSRRFMFKRLENNPPNALFMTSSGHSQAWSAALQCR